MGPKAAGPKPVAKPFGSKPIISKPAGAKPFYAKATPRPQTSGPRAVSRPAQPAKPPIPRPPSATDWSEVAEWYDRLVGDEGSEYQQKVVFPGVVRLLQLQRGELFLDVACGQGVLSRLLQSKGAVVTAIDAAEPLVASARERGPADITYHVGDARELERMPAIPPGAYSSAACVLAIQNIHPITGVCAGVAKALKPMGRFVIVMMHPSFRGPKETSWGWDDQSGVQYRRVDRYLIPRKSPIVTHPGSAPDIYTWTFHKPLEAYVRALRGAGLLVDAIEEWPSHKTSQPGPRSAAENQAREEIPMFMAIRAVKVTGI